MHAATKTATLDAEMNDFRLLLINTPFFSNVRALLSQRFKRQGKAGMITGRLII
jgi:hypothetical protein